jgi:hypothetical protein
MGVHLCHASFDGTFRVMLDSDLFLPDKGWDADRRKEAGIPDSLVYRPKHLIGLEQLRRAAVNGLHFRMDHRRHLVRGKAGVHPGP